jgi:hypothetical protein
MNEEINMPPPVKPLRRLKIDSGKKITIFIASNTHPITIKGPNRFFDAHVAPIIKIIGSDKMAINIRTPNAIPVISLIFSIMI